MRPRRLSRLAVVVLSVLALGATAMSACADDTFTRDDAVERLRDAGLSQASAECLVDALIDEIGLDHLNVERDASDEEREIAGLFEDACADGRITDDERDSIRETLAS